MTSASVRVLLLADTHLGFDLPFRPRIERRRRGHDFFANFELALGPAMRGEVDLVVHGGDLLYRSKVPAALVEMAMAPVVRVASLGIPVFMVPGNHERSRIPMQLWGMHPNVHMFDEPKTFARSIAGMRLAISGFPFRRDIREVFHESVERTGYRNAQADVSLLCMHQTVEGARVGPRDYTFRGGSDVVRARDIPAIFPVVLCGHIHRRQVLTHDLAGHPIAAPVVYPGSVERTSFAERGEPKGYMILEVAGSDDGKGRLRQIRFSALPARPMFSLELNTSGRSRTDLAGEIRARVEALDPDAVVRIRFMGSPDADGQLRLTASEIRALAPRTMNVQVTHDWTAPSKHGRPRPDG